MAIAFYFLAFLQTWEIETASLFNALDKWLDLIGSAAGGKLRLELLAPGGKDASEPKHGKEDPNNEPHVCSRHPR